MTSELNSHSLIFRALGVVGSLLHFPLFFTVAATSAVRKPIPSHYYPSAVSKSPLDCCSTTKKLRLMRRRKNCMNTGCSDWKWSKVDDCSTETVHNWPHFSKVKMSLRGRGFFNFQKVCIFQLFVYKFSKKNSVSQTHFGFTNLASKMHRFSATAIYFSNFNRNTL